MLPYFLPTRKYLSKINVISAYNYKLILVFDSLRHDEAKKSRCIDGKKLSLGCRIIDYVDVTRRFFRQPCVVVAIAVLNTRGNKLLLLQPTMRSSRSRSTLYLRQ